MAYLHPLVDRPKGPLIALCESGDILNLKADIVIARNSVHEYVGMSHKNVMISSYFYLIFFISQPLGRIKEVTQQDHMGGLQKPLHVAEAPLHEQIGIELYDPCKHATLGGEVV